MSSFTYDVSGPDMTDPNYGEVNVVPYAYSGLKSNASWVEGVLLHGMERKIQDAAERKRTRKLHTMVCARLREKRRKQLQSDV